jgi:Arc/MetJ-type ribon-helix-helix transcriptional regulator
MSQKKNKKGRTKEKMRNITINIPENYDYNIQKLIKMKLLPSRSEAIRTALREFLNREYNKNLGLLEFFEWENKAE